MNDYEYYVKFFEEYSDVDLQKRVDNSTIQFYIYDLPGNEYVEAQNMLRALKDVATKRNMKNVERL